LEIATMTKILAVAAVFLVASVTATASLLHQPVARVHSDTMQDAETTAADTRRGTRLALVTDADSPPAVGDQPRRGQRTGLRLAGNSMSAQSADGLRRGTR
jgi:hypothetical protein